MGSRGLRVALLNSSASLALVGPSRGIYTTWSSIPNESWATKEPWLQRITNQSRYRSFDFWHVPEVKTPDGIKLSQVEQYLLSCVEDDTKRLLNLSWTFDFDPFWWDRVNSHEKLYRIIYTNEFSFFRYIFGDHSENLMGQRYIEKKLNYLRSVLHWAFETEKCYSAIAKARFTVQRDVWNALERERYLAGCVEAVELFKREVPQEFSEKALGELENHLTNMRHWVWDCPNAKRLYPQLA
ncbi:hypothetical protein TRVL_00718 [Trypanosoma vivax]|nr:hypothetical protein TRVL_00718 [Trypanosoma vivax]